MKKEKLLDVGDLILSRRQFHEPESFNFPSISKEFFKNIYFEVYDQSINGLRERFGQPDYQIHVNLQELILKAL